MHLFGSIVCRCKTDAPVEFVGSSPNPTPEYIIGTCQKSLAVVPTCLRSLTLLLLNVFPERLICIHQESALKLPRGAFLLLAVHLHDPLLMAFKSLASRLVMPESNWSRGELVEPIRLFSWDTCLDTMRSKPGPLQCVSCEVLELRNQGHRRIRSIGGSYKSQTQAYKHKRATWRHSYPQFSLWLGSAVRCPSSSLSASGR